MHSTKLTYIVRSLGRALFALCLGLLIFGPSSSAGLSADQIQTRTSLLSGSSEVSSYVSGSQFLEHFDNSSTNWVASSEHEKSRMLAFWVGLEQENVKENERYLQDRYDSGFLKKAFFNSSGNSTRAALLVLPFVKELSLTLLSTVVFLH